MAEKKWFEGSIALAGWRVAGGVLSIAGVCERARSPEKWWRFYSPTRQLGWTPRGKTTWDWANRLCNREEAFIDFSGRRLAWTARGLPSDVKRAKLEKRARALTARIERYELAREQTDTDPQAVNGTLKTTEWNGVRIERGARSTDSNFVLLGTIFLLPFVFWSCEAVETVMIAAVQAGWLPGIVQRIVDYVMVLGTLLSPALIAVFLGLFPRLARWIAWPVIVILFGLMIGGEIILHYHGGR